MPWPRFGHWKLGRTDAVARFAILGWAFGALLVVLVSRFGKADWGPPSRCSSCSANFVTLPAARR
jgi:uncharacterized YccA/Bax inhibitor family protein